MCWEVRNTRADELDEVMGIFAHARQFMAEQGNPDQWGAIGWPPRDIIENDIAIGKSYVATYEGRIAAVFYYDYGYHVDPTYGYIEGEGWISDEPYGVVHRIASSHIVRGAGTKCLEWALQQSHGHLRIDTGEKNIPLQNLLAKLGFSHRGTIFLDLADTDSRDNMRLAFEAYEHV